MLVDFGLKMCKYLVNSVNEYEIEKKLEEEEHNNEHDDSVDDRRHRLAVFWVCDVLNVHRERYHDYSQQERQQLEQAHAE